MRQNLRTQSALIIRVTFIIFEFLTISFSFLVLVRNCSVAFYIFNVKHTHVCTKKNFYAVFHNQPKILIQVLLICCFESENEVVWYLTMDPHLQFPAVFFFFLWRCFKCWNGFSLQMRCFQLSLLCIFWRKQARLVSFSGDAAERIEWLISAENIVRILRGRRPFFPTECQPFPSCYRSSNKRQRCLKSHLGLNWIRTEPVKPRRCLEAELCFAVTLTDSWAKERKGRPSKLLWVNGESLWTWKEIWKQTSSKAAGLIQGLNVEKHLYTWFCLFFVCVSLWLICLCAFGCELFFFGFMERHSRCRNASVHHGAEVAESDRK